MPKLFYITTAIDYTNGAPHIGHAYEKVLADVIARYHRLKGEEVFFLTGVDQHGQKVQQSAEKAGVPPQQFVDEITAKFVALWDKLEISYDRSGGWAATTDPLHKKCVQGMLQRLYEEGKIYKDKQEGHYSVRQEQFLTDKEREPDGEFGPEWGQVEHRVEENYYFRLAEHKDWLLGYLKSEKGRDCVTPDFRQTELLNAVEKLSGDLCISRPKSRLSWGIELPFDRDYVNYVWFDALTNYISFIGYDPTLKNWEDQPNEFRNRWPALHVIGKDILIPAHGIYWMIMLHALGFPDEQMPKFLVHGWWNISGAKMSKSLGNVVDPNELADKYGAEALRHYLMSDIVVGKDSDFEEGRLIETFNSLGNRIGNLLNRILPLIAKFREGKLTRLSDERRLTVFSYRFKFDEIVGTYAESFKTHSVNNAIDSSLAASLLSNLIIDEEKPWSLAKLPDETRRVESLFYTLAEALRISAILISPVLPRAAHGIFDQLKWKMELSGQEKRFSLADAVWGQLPAGHVVGKPIPLLPRIEQSPG